MTIQKKALMLNPTYIYGSLAKNYLNESLFQQAEISIQWMDYADYPIYMKSFGDK